MEKTKFKLTKHLNKTALRERVLRQVRNRSGHRPHNANIAGGDFVVASYNVHKCVGTDKKFDPARIINVIAEMNADFVALQEADKRFGQRIGLIDLVELKKHTGLEPVQINTMSPNGHGWHGNAIFLRKGVVRDVVQITLPGVEPRGALIVEIELEAGPLRIVAAHFGLLRHSRNKQAKIILSEIEQRIAMPTIMVGDLNEWRLGKGSSLEKLAPYFNVQLGTVPSFPSRFPVLALDRVFAFPHDLVSSIECHSSALSRIASDHLPLKAHINLSHALNTLNMAKPIV